MRRRLLATAAASVILATALVGCSTATDQSAGSVTSQGSGECTVPLSPGMLTNSVELTRMTDSTPSITITGGTDIVNAQRSVIRQAEGAQRQIRGSEVVTTNITVFDAETGATVMPTQLRFLQPIPAELTQTFSEFLASSDAGRLTYMDLAMASLLCASPGEVLAVGMTAEQAITSSLGTEAMVTVIEVVDARELRAEGAQRTLPWGFPAIATTQSGQPGIILPPLDAPAELRIATAIEGDGREIADSDYLLGHVLTVEWGGAVSENSWNSSVAEIGAVGESSYSFRSELSGHSIGSRIVIIEPSGDSALVHVVDVIIAG